MFSVFPFRLPPTIFRISIVLIFIILPPGNKNENIIQIKNHEAFIIKATCPDHLCIKQGKINKKGATIVCLPHHLVVEVIEGNEGKEDGKVY